MMIGSLLKRTLCLMYIALSVGETGPTTGG